MKKLIAIILCIMLCLALTACGSDSPKEPEKDEAATSDAAPVEPEESDEPVSDEESSEELTEPESSEEAEGAAAFDTSWASNDFEALLPQLPFAGWTVTEQTDSSYAAEVSGLKTVVNPEDPTDPEGVDKVKLIDYLDSLTAFGFTVEETGENYQWKVTDKLGNSFEFMCAEGFCWLKINKIS